MTMTANWSTLTVDALLESPDNIRKTFDADKIGELATSILGVGLISPLVVTPHDSGRYFVVAGNRRLRAIRHLIENGDLPSDFPIQVTFTDAENGPNETALMLVENLQRVDINPVEEARGYGRLISEFRMTPKELSKTVGRSVPHIQSRLALLTLPDDVQRHVGESLPIGVAVRLAEVTDPKLRKEVMKEAAKGSIPEWRVENVLRTQRNHADTEALSLLVEASGLSTFPTLKEANLAWRACEYLACYTVDEFGTYVPDPAHVLVLSGPKLNVYRRLTDEEIAEQEQADRAGLRRGEEWTPHHDWRVAMREFEDERSEWKDRQFAEWGHVIRSLNKTDLFNTVLEIVAADTLKPTSRHYVDDFEVASLLGLTVPEDTRPDEVFATFATDLQSSLQLFLARNVCRNDGEVQSAPLMALYEQRLADLGMAGDLLMPDELAIEPWLNGNGVWITDCPNPDTEEPSDDDSYDAYEHEEDDDEF